MDPNSSSRASRDARSSRPETLSSGGENQWPDRICFGPIRYQRASNYDGFSLSDVEHGIPTFGSVSPTEPLTIRGQSVHVFNYPGQTEAIAAQLVHRWNCHEDLLEALKTLLRADEDDRCDEAADRRYISARNQARAAVALAEGEG